MTIPLPRSKPAEHDVDPAALLALVDAFDTDPVVEVHSLQVVRHGHVVAEGWWAPHTPDRARLLYSLSKSFTSTALGMAVAEGLLDLDDTVLAHLPELDGDVTDPRSRATTLRHLARMASGHTREMWEEAVTNDRQDPVRGFLTVPPDEEPGSVFAYSQPCTYTLAAVIQRVTGERLTDYLRPRLFDPLGIGEVGWQAFPDGSPEIGFSGLFARTEDVAKLGLLYLRGGRWGSEQLVPAAWVHEATTRQIATPDGDSENWAAGYGYQFWMSRHGYRGDGAFGQFCVVLPEHDTVVAITAGTAAMPEVLDHLWTHLLPGLDGGPTDAGVQTRLDARLRDLALPPVPAGSAPPTWDGARFAVVAPSEPGDRTGFTSVDVRHEGERLEVTLAEAEDALTFAVGAGEWITSEPTDRRGDPVAVAASAGWVDERTLRIEVVFLETPHRVDLVCSPADGTPSGTATWRVPPMPGTRIATLHRPR